ncbi:MAG TPA: LON peptidase substrate-binding domain-containing protein [Streptosporangiaceae bacterium]
MTELLPLFPLGTVLYPGMVLPLHIFEDRYRQLIQDLLRLPEPREFGVIAIKEGRETGADGVTSLYEIGCVAELRDVTETDDGEFDIVTIGTDRFRLLSGEQVSGEQGLDRSQPYLRGHIERLPDEAGEAGSLTVPAAHASFRAYLDALVEQGGATVLIEELPTDPELLSYVIAAAMIIELSTHQALLAEPDAGHRLAAERTLLARETAMLRATTTRPAPDLTSTPFSPN